MTSALIELHYLPSIPYFSALFSAQKIIIEKYEHFEKQSYRNRCHILTAQGVERLILPLTSKRGKVLITEVRIDYSQKWLNNHWRTIESAYRSSPFFEYYADDLHKILFKQHTFLYDLNFELLTICLKWLKSDVTLVESMAFEKIPSNGVVDLRNVIHAKKSELYDSYFRPVAYQQVFGNKFVEGLSILDLVFCEGPNSRKVVMSSAKPH
ncbi:MAG TPA: WbqC family protein [Cyclobacteriaceae bacterium]